MGLLLHSCMVDGGWAVTVGVGRQVGRSNRGPPHIIHYYPSGLLILLPHLLPWLLYFSFIAQWLIKDLFTVVISM